MCLSAASAIEFQFFAIQLECSIELGYLSVCSMGKCNPKGWNVYCRLAWSCCLYAVEIHNISPNRMREKRCAQKAAVLHPIARFYMRDHKFGTSVFFEAQVWLKWACVNEILWSLSCLPVVLGYLRRKLDHFRRCNNLVAHWRASLSTGCISFV